MWLFADSLLLLFFCCAGTVCSFEHTSVGFSNSRMFNHYELLLMIYLRTCECFALHHACVRVCSCVCDWGSGFFNLITLIVFLFYFLYYSVPECSLYFSCLHTPEYLVVIHHVSELITRPLLLIAFVLNHIIVQYYCCMISYRISTTSLDRISRIQSQ